MYSDEAAVLPRSPPRHRLNEPSWRPRPPPHDEPGLPPDPARTYGRHRQEPWDGARHAVVAPQRIVSTPSRARHVTFSAQEPHLDKATGAIQHVRVPSSAAGRPGLPRSSSHGVRVDSDDEEHFVDGSFFFNHLVRNKEAEDYNMAEMLRERSRELQRRRLLAAPRRPWPGAEAERLSTSLPADYFVSKPAGCHTYRGGRPREAPQPQDTPFADGLEIEIPPRRHGGLGGGGLRQSLSADRLLMVPPSHRDPARFGRHYFRPGLPGEQPTSYSSATLAPRTVTPQPPEDQRRVQPETTGVYAPRFGIPGPEPATNRYNVRTGRFEPDMETPPELPPKAPPPKLGPIRYENESWDNRRNVVLAAGRRPPLHPGTRLRNPDTTWTAQGEGRPRHDPRLSVSLDPARLRGPDYGAQNTANALREVGQEPQPRKGVTWRDLEPHRLPGGGALNLSRTHPSGGFQENLGYDDQESSRDDTRSSFREGFSYPSNDSLLRSLAVNDLQNVDQFALFEVSTSKLNWAESFMGTNLLDKMTQYKFVVLNRHEEVLFFGAEDDNSISNCILSPQKSSFKVRILDANGHDFVHFRRLYPVKPKTNLTIGNKKKYRLEVATPSGHVIGNVEKTYNSDTYYILEDRAGACLFLVQRSCICTCPLFWDYEFKILVPEGDAEVGEISWSYLTAQDEQFNGTEISFPMDLNTTSKIMLLGVCFLLNFSRWQSAYLDSMHNPRARKGKVRQGSGDESREVAALLKTSPEDHGFHASDDVEDVGTVDSHGPRSRDEEGGPS